MELDDEVLSAWTDGAWSSNKPVLVIQSGADGERDISANFGRGRGNRLELTIEAGMPLYAGIRPLLDGFDEAYVYCTSETIFTDAVMSWPRGQENRIKRFIRTGDCQASGSFGSADEQMLAEYVLEALGDDVRAIAVVSVVGTSLVFGQCNFKVSDELFFLPLKTVRPLEEFANVVVPQLVARFGLRRIAGVDRDSRDRLARTLAGTPYAALLVTVADPDPDRSTRRAALRAALSTSAEGPRKPKLGLFVDWLRTRRPPAGDRSGGSGPSKRAIELFYTVRDAENASPAFKAEATALLSQLPVKSGNFAHAALILSGLREGSGGFAEAVDGLGEFESGHPCRRELVSAIAACWITGHEQSGWAEALFDTEIELLREAMLVDDDAYRWARSELARSPDQRLANLLFFESREDEERYGKSVRSSMAELEAKVGLEDGYSFFTTLLFCSHVLPVAELETWLERAKAKWGETLPEYWREVHTLRLRQDPKGDSLEACRCWVELDSENACAHQVLGGEYQHLKDYPAAEQAFRRSLELRDDNAPVWMKLAWSLVHQDRYEEAREAAWRGYRLLPGAEQLEAIAKVLYLLDDPELAPLLADLSDKDLVDADLVRIFLIETAKTADASNYQERFAALHGELSEEDLITTMYKAAWNLIDADRAALATKLWAPLVMDAPEHFKAGSAVSIAFERSDRPEAGLAFYRDRPVLSQHPRSKVARIRLHLYGAKFELAEARQLAAEAAAASEPPFGAVFFNALLSGAGSATEEAWEAIVADTGSDPAETSSALLLASLVLNRPSEFQSAALVSAAAAPSWYRCANDALISLSRGDVEQAHADFVQARLALGNVSKERVRSYVREFCCDLAVCRDLGLLDAAGPFLERWSSEAARPVSAG